ncbi:hypothetical protein EV193_101960 [Herbihabitans rhizosphaerae]|uniref:Uncharacterized protein n=1 Tax=Herbihabitans rhizosphaerae TaxID=1872711 RepID=A0A4Q7L6X0_9PSEU|nr:hypothetical protein [Herbihabitans rhizosphaerae]RZS45074.1 hypothetical protein EV193_101960 [Herbihabitans rhizosphaerae]
MTLGIGDRLPAVGTAMNDSKAELGRSIEMINKLSELTASGKVAVDPIGGGSLLSAIGDARTRVAELRQSGDSIDHKPPLGADPVSTAMAKKFHGRAGKDDLSFLTVLGKYEEALEAVESNVRAAMRNYTSTDGGNAIRFRPGVQA